VCQAVGVAVTNRLPACLCEPTVQVPAVPDTRVVDVTGCGNAFCGGMLAGLDAGLSVADSGAWGCVAGSIMAEHQGVPSADVQQLVGGVRAKHERLLSRTGWSRAHVAPVASTRRLQRGRATCGPRAAGAQVAVRWL
jgi:bifunctional ADP-heptose synthase (sugar kinase/adenylyltransferase)